MFRFIEILDGTKQAKNQNMVPQDVTSWYLRMFYAAENQIKHMRCPRRERMQKDTGIKTALDLLPETMKVRVREKFNILGQKLCYKPRTYYLTI